MIGKTAFWFSLLTVSYWAFWNFHYPDHPNVIRFSVTRRRYVLGVVLYVAIAVTVFLLAALFAQVIELRLLPAHLSSEFETGIPLAMALTVTVLLPRLWKVRFLVDETRRLVQSLALYPYSAEQLTTLLAQGQARPDQEARAQLRSEVAAFAIEPGALDSAFPPAALAPVEEAHGLRLSVLSALEDERLAPFKQARARQIDEARLEHLRLLRRFARTILLAQVLRNAPPPLYAEEGDERPDIAALSQFLREESHAVSLRLHRLAAEAALSMFHHPRARQRFLRGLGYDPPLKSNLPFAAIVTVACVAPATATLGLVVPTLGSLARAVGLAFPDSPPPNPAVLAAFSILQLTIVLWAVVPKGLTRWAWPQSRSRSATLARRLQLTLDQLPLGSYALAAAGAFLSQALTGLLLVGSGEMPKQSPFGVPSLELMLITGVFAVVSTVGLCLMIDRSVLNDQLQLPDRRWPNGLILAAVMMVADQLIVQPAIVRLGGKPPGLPPTLFMGMLGFLLGALVPSSVTAWLNRDLTGTARRDSSPQRVPAE